jgi:hypothetical protein
MTGDYVRSLGRLAYLWGSPLVNGSGPPCEEAWYAWLASVPRPADVDPDLADTLRAAVNRSTYAVKVMSHTTAPAIRSAGAYAGERWPTAISMPRVIHPKSPAMATLARVPGGDGWPDAAGRRGD